MKYEVAHSLLASPGRTFKRGEVVTEAELVEHGFTVAHLLAHNGIEALKGTEDAVEPTAPVAPPAPAHPSPADVPPAKPHAKAKHAGGHKSPTDDDE